MQLGTMLLSVWILKSRQHSTALGVGMTSPFAVAEKKFALVLRSLQSTWAKKRKRKECSNIAALWLSIAARSRSYWQTFLQGLTATEHLFAEMKESCSVARKTSGRKCCCELVGKSLPLFSKTKKKNESQSPRFTALVLADRLKKVVVTCVWEAGCSF